MGHRLDSSHGFHMSLRGTVTIGTQTLFDEITPTPMGVDGTWGGQEVPPGHLIRVLGSSGQNVLTSVAALPEHVDFLDSTATLMHELAGARGRPAETASELATRSLASHGTFYYIAAAQCTLATQAHPVQVLTRSAIECLAYAARCRDSDEAFRAWKDRHKDFLRTAAGAIKAGTKPDIRAFMAGDKKNRSESRKQFERSRLEESMRNVLAGERDGAQVVRALFDRYDLAIDMGAHPNLFMTLLASRSEIPDEGETAFRVDSLFHGDVIHVRESILALCSLGALMTRVMVVLLPECSAEVDAQRRLAQLGEVSRRLDGTRTTGERDRLEPCAVIAPDGAE